MQFSPDRKMMRVAIAVGAFATVGALACSDNLTRPRITSGADEDFAMSGVLVSSLMRADAGADAPISGVTAPVQIGDPAGQHNFIGAPTRVSVDAGEANALRTQAITPAKLGVSGAGPLFNRGANGAKSILRPRATGRSFKSTKDGNALELQFVDDPRGGNRPPSAVVTWVNGRATSVNQYTYRKVGKAWVPTASRTTIYDSTGKAAFVTSNSYAAMTLSVASLGNLGGDAFTGGIGKLVTALGRLVQPDVLYAETVADASDSGCMMKGIAAASAEVAWLTAVAALATAWGACAATILECPAVIAAQVALAAADFTLGKTQAEYAQCLMEQQPQPPVPPSGGGGSAKAPLEDDGSCGTLIWEISYDNGDTWNYLGTTSTC